MADVVGTAVVRLTTDGSRVGSTAAQAGKSAGSSFRSSFIGSMKGLLSAVGVTAGAAAVVGAIRSSIGEAREAQKVGAATAQIIKTTGGVANVTTKEIQDLTTAMAAKVAIDDELIQSGANVLLTFQNVRNEVGKNNDVFDQAVQAAVDLSALGFTSITGASKMLGKALNDPIVGMSALTRIGVTFTDQEKEQIKALVEHNDLLGAQGLILDKVQGKVGGLAESQATAGEKMSVVWRNLLEQLGTLLLPMLDRIETWAATVAFPHISTFVTEMQEGKGAGGDFADALGEVKDVLGGMLDLAEPVFGAIMDVVSFLADNPDVVTAAAAGWITFKAAVSIASIVQALAGALGLLTAAEVAEGAAATGAAAGTGALSVTLFGLTLPISLIVAALALLVAGFVYAYTHSETFKRIVDDSLHVVGEVVKWLAPIFKFYFGLMVRYVNFLLDAVKALGRGALWLWDHAFRPAISFILSAIGTLLRGVANMADAFSWVPIFGDKFDGLARKIDGVADKVFGLRDAINSLHDKDITIAVNWRQTGTPAPGGHMLLGAEGMVIRKPTFLIAGEAGPEVLVPLTPGAKVNPEVTAALGAGARGGRATGLPDTVILRVGARDFVAYIEQVTDRRVAAADSLVGAR